jgi:tetratricopeptide (TPR) repeat protein
MSDADQIQVAELPQSLEKNENERTFVVKIRPRASSRGAKALESNESQILENAELLLKNGEVLLARNLYSFVLRKNLKNERAMEGLGVCFFRLNEIVAAKKCFKALWEIHQRSDYAIRLAMCFVSEKNDVAAVSLFEQVKEDSVLQAQLKEEYFRSYGNLLSRRNQLEQAESFYEKALRISPNSSPVLVNLGMLNLKRENRNGAVACFRKALSIEPMNSKACCGMGIVHYESGEKEKALESFLLALDFDKKNPVALQYLIPILEGSPQKSLLMGRIFEFLKNEPNHGEIRFQYARLLMQENRFSEAMEEADRALKLLPQDSRVGELKKLLIQNRHRGIQ